MNSFVREALSRRPAPPSRTPWISGIGLAIFTALLGLVAYGLAVLASRLPIADDPARKFVFFAVRMGAFYDVLLLLLKPLRTRSVRGALRSALLTVMGGTLVFAAASVLLGASLVADSSGVLQMSLVLATIAAVPPAIVFGADLDVLRDMFVRLHMPTSVHRLVALPALLSVLGTWASAVVLPLDWDVWWQQWPIPGVVGCFAGWYLGLVLCTIVALVRPDPIPGVASALPLASGARAAALPARRAAVPSAARH